MRLSTSKTMVMVEVISEGELGRPEWDVQDASLRNFQAAWTTVRRKSKLQCDGNKKAFPRSRSHYRCDASGRPTPPAVPRRHSSLLKASLVEFDIGQRPREGINLGIPGGIRNEF